MLRRLITRSYTTSQFDCLNKKNVNIVDCLICFFYNLLLKKCFVKQLQRAIEFKHSIDKYKDGVDENIRFLMYLAIREVRGH